MFFERILQWSFRVWHLKLHLKNNENIELIIRLFLEILKSLKLWDACLPKKLESANHNLNWTKYLYISILTIHGLINHANVYSRLTFFCILKYGAELFGVWNRFHLNKSKTSFQNQIFQYRYWLYGESQYLEIFLAI